MQQFFTLFICLLFSISNAQNKSLQLIISKEKNKDYILSIKNNSNKDIKIPKTVYQDFWCFNSVCINFIGETKKGNQWIPLTEFKSTIIDLYQSDKKQLINLTKGLTTEIFKFKFSKGIETWFGLFGHQNIRLSAEYIVDNNKISINYNVYST